jgi:hypothetical protein
MRRVFICLIWLFPAIAVTACSDATASHEGQVYWDSAGWTVDVPPGWHVDRFSDSKDSITAAGAQLSNVRLPAPSLIPGYPIQVNDTVLPAGGVDLIIATDSDPALSHGTLEVPPLPYPEAWAKESAPAGTPYIETLWFRAGGTTFLATAKIGPGATSADLKALAGIVHSLQ